MAVNRLHPRPSPLCGYWLRRLGVNLLHQLRFSLDGMLPDVIAGALGMSRRPKNFILVLLQQG